MTELSLKAVDYPTSESFDALMRSHFGEQKLAVHLDGGTFYTHGTREWDDSADVTQNAGFRIKDWTFDSQSGATLAWDYEKVVPAAVPFALIRTAEAWNDLSLYPHHTPQEVWDILPRGQRVTDLNFDLQYSKALPLWRKAGIPLRIGAVALGGHQAAIEHCTLTDWGAWGLEGFPFDISGGWGMYDRNLMAQLDPTKYIFDDGVTDLECSHITDCICQSVDETLSNTQVTARMIMGSMGNPSLDRTQWVQIMRAYAYQRGNQSNAKGQNLFQGHTIYQCLRGDIDHNATHGFAVGAYGDYCANVGLNVDLNQFLGCDYAGIRFLLSPTTSGETGLATQFSHTGYKIGPNLITSRSGVQVELNTLEDQLPLGPRRYISNMEVDASLQLEVKGSIPGIVRTGQITAKARGCSPATWFR